MDGWTHTHLRGTFRSFVRRNFQKNFSHQCQEQCSFEQLLVPNDKCVSHWICKNVRLENDTFCTETMSKALFGPKGRKFTQKPKGNARERREKKRLEYLLLLYRLLRIFLNAEKPKNVKMVQIGQFSASTYLEIYYDENWKGKQS